MKIFGTALSSINVDYSFM